MTATDAWLSPKQTAELLGVTTARVRQLSLEGRLMFTQTPLGRMFNRTEIRREAARRAAARKEQKK